MKHKHGAPSIDIPAQLGNADVVRRSVPNLSDDDKAAIAEIHTNEAFTLKKSAGMYAGVKRLRPKK